MKQPGEDSEASWSSRSVLGVRKSTSHQCLVLFSLGGLVVGRLSCCSFSLGDLLFAKLYDLGKATPESKQHRRIQFFGPKSQQNFVRNSDAYELGIKYLILFIQITFNSFKPLAACWSSEYCLAASKLSCNK